MSLIPSWVSVFERKQIEFETQENAFQPLNPILQTKGIFFSSYFAIALGCNPCIVHALTEVLNQNENAFQIVKQLPKAVWRPEENRIFFGSDVHTLSISLVKASLDEYDENYCSFGLTFKTSTSPYLVGCNYVTPRPYGLGTSDRWFSNKISCSKNWRWFVKRAERHGRLTRTFRARATDFSTLVIYPFDRNISLAQFRVYNMGRILQLESLTSYFMYQQINYRTVEVYYDEPSLKLILKYLAKNMRVYPSIHHRTKFPTFGPLPWRGEFIREKPNYNPKHEMRD